MQALTKIIKDKPEYHKVISVKDIIDNHGKPRTQYKLKHNSELFKQALCAGMDTEIFYPDKDMFSHEEMAVFESLCIECPIMLQCLEWALAHEANGIWGGTTPATRRKVRNQIGWSVIDPAPLELRMVK